MISKISDVSFDCTVLLPSDVKTVILVRDFYLECAMLLFLLYCSLKTFLTNGLSGNVMSHTVMKSQRGMMENLSGPYTLLPGFHRLI